MSPVRNQNPPINPVVALAIADLHLWHKPPIARSAEGDWFEAMARPFLQLKDIQKRIEEELDMIYGTLPIICAGDVFDRFNPTPELLNWCIRWLSKMYSVAGQHDLPNHNYKDIRKTGYMNLVEAGTLIHLPRNRFVEIPGAFPIRLHGFSWGQEIRPLKKDHSNSLYLDIAVCHKYVWDGQLNSYKDAPKENHTRELRKQLTGYDIAVFGDNHIGFINDPEDRKSLIINCGTFLRRKQDEKHYRPAATLIHANGTVESEYLDCSADKFLDSEETLSGMFNNAEGLLEFVEELGKLGDAVLNFTETVMRVLKKENVDEAVKRIIMGAMEEGRK